MNQNYVTPQEISKIRERMGLNLTQFAFAVGVKGGQNIQLWETGKTRPTGDRYQRLLLLKKQYLSNGHSVKPMLSFRVVLGILKQAAKLTEEEREALIAELKEM